MKKFLTLTLSLLTAAVCVTAAGCDLFDGLTDKDTVTDDGIQYKITSDDTYQVVGFKDSSDSRTELVIPDTVKKKSVTVIGGKAFYSNTKIKSVTIPDTVTSIGNQAFAFCSSLEKVTVGKGLNRMYEGVFGKCEKLKSVYISDLSGWCAVDYSVPSEDNTYYGLSNPLSYGAKLYVNGSAVTNLVIPDDVKVIRAFTFSDCTGIETVYIPQGVTSLTAAAFTGSSLKSYNVDENNNNFSSENGVLYNKSKTELIHVPDGFTGELTVNDNVDKIPRNAFNGRENITSVTLGSGVRSVGEYVFSNTDKLERVVLQKGITEIHREAFYSCNAKICFTGTKSEFDKIKVTGTDGMNYIPSTTFGDVEYNYNLNSNSPSQGDGSGSGSTGGTGGSIGGNTGSTPTPLNNFEFGEVTIYDKDYNEIKGYEIWADIGAVLKSQIVLPSEYNGKPVISIQEYGFLDCRDLVSIEIPSSIIHIGKNAFYNSTKLSSAKFLNTQGWKVQKFSQTPINIDVTNASTAAQLLKSTYSEDFIWKCV